jgi:hypothetical protein
MKRFVLGVCSLALFCSISPVASAQMGTDLFKPPSIAKVFKPVVGQGAEYQTTNSSDKKVHTIQMGAVGKESVEGKDGYWLEFSFSDSNGGNILTKMLFTKDDMQSHKVIFQMPGQQAMQMPFNAKDANQQKMENEMSEWRSVGMESITVPAGSFSCEHWHNDKKNSDVWTNDKVTPFAMVKEVSPTSSMLLTKVMADFPERITGPVAPFDPQQMMLRHQQNKP